MFTWPVPAEAGREGQRSDNMIAPNDDLCFA